MTEQPVHGDFMAELCARRAAEGPVFWAGDNELAIFDPAVARQIHSTNFADFSIGDRLIDAIRGKTSQRVTWTSIRSLWLAKLRTMDTASHHEALLERMSALAEQRVGKQLDLPWFGQDIITRPLVPVVIDGLSPRAARAVHADLTWKIAHLMRAVGPRRKRPLWHAWGMVVGQSAAALAVRAEIRGRARGSRPPRDDLTAPIVEELPRLGIDRAVDAVTTVLTAIGGPPGSAGGSVIYELVRQPEWAARLTDELSNVDYQVFIKGPVQAAPLTVRFVREVLRLWSPPLLLARVARMPLEVPGGTVRPGQHYLLSPYMIHHDPESWPDPDTFDPDRWLTDAPNGPSRSTAYIPFGWSPTSCIGASLGMVQLVMLCYLLCTRIRVESDASNSRMMLAAVPIPRDFTGFIQRRAHS